MKLLVLGGTLFLGRHLVEAALARGHEVTLFNRGRTNPALYPDVEKLRGDRDGDLTSLAARTWDTVVDTSGYVPRVVSASAELLAGAVDHYTFVSSVSVYRDFATLGIRESHPVATVDDETAEDVDEHYGALKALCERVVARVFPGRSLCVRAGLVVGPHDPTNRFTYWVRRVSEGGEVLAPEPRDQPVQLIDARDLAAWILASAEERRAGVFNATGPETPRTMDALLYEIKAETGADARFIWADADFLVEASVTPWAGLPLWLAGDPAWQGLTAVDVTRAVAAGLTYRPLAETIRDTLAWAECEPAPDKDFGVSVGQAGLDRGREAELLAAWRARAAA